MMIKKVGKSRPRVVNILEGPRSFELQIWWEVSPWVTGVHPVSSRAVVKNPEVDEEGWSRAVKRVGASKQKSNDEGQKKQARKINWGKKQGTGDGDAVGTASEAMLIGSGGAHEERWDFKSDRNWSEGEGLTQHAGPGGGSCIHPGLKGVDYPGPRDIISKSPAFIKVGKGMQYGPQLQQAGAHTSPSVGAARRVEKFGSKPGSTQAGPSNWLENLNQSKKDNRGLKKGFTKARSGFAGGTSGFSEEWRMKEGSTRPGVEGASNPLSDPAWICARGALLHAKEGWSGRERTSSFESSWEKEMSLVNDESPTTGGPGQGNGGEGFLVDSSLALLEAFSTSPEVVDPKALRLHAKGTRCDTLPSTDCSSPLVSVFGRPLLPGVFSGSPHESDQNLNPGKATRDAPLNVVSNIGGDEGAYCGGEKSLNPIGGDEGVSCEARRNSICSEESSSAPKREDEGDDNSQAEKAVDSEAEGARKLAGMGSRSGCEARRSTPVHQENEGVGSGKASLVRGLATCVGPDLVVGRKHGMELGLGRPSFMDPGPKPNLTFFSHALGFDRCTCSKAMEMADGLRKEVQSRPPLQLKHNCSCSVSTEENGAHNWEADVNREDHCCLVFPYFQC